MKQLTSKQCRFLMLFYVALNKIMLLPSLICSNLTNNFWLLLIVMFGLEFLFILMILSLNKQFPDLTLKQRMQMVFGKIFTKIFYFLIGLLLLFKLVLIIHECYIFLYDSLYSNYKWIELIIPLAIFMIYVGAKSFTNFGRCIQIIRAIIYGCIAIALFDATSNLNLLNMLPVFTTTVNRTLHTCFNYSIWFGDFILLLFAVGDVKMDKNTNKNIICGWLIGVFITFITMAFFYMTYGIICPLRRMAIIDITQFVPKLSNSSNFFWLVTTSWTVPICFNIGFLTFLVCQSFENCFELKKENHKWMSLIVSVGAMILLAIFNFRLNNMSQFLNNGFVYYVFVVQYILPLIILPILAIQVDKKQKRRFKYVK